MIYFSAVWFENNAIVVDDSSNKENIIAEKDTVSAKLTDGMLTVKFKKVRDIKIEVDK